MAVGHAPCIIWFIVKFWVDSLEIAAERRKNESFPSLFFHHNNRPYGRCSQRNGRNSFFPYLAFLQGVLVTCHFSRLVIRTIIKASGDETHHWVGLKVKKFCFFSTPMSTFYSPHQGTLSITMPAYFSCVHHTLGYMPVFTACPSDTY